ncbi:carotenoid oxygenase family protein [Aggregatilineales bacterium SYSU G02658]
MSADYTLGLTTQPNELTQLSLDVQGRIPSWLRGTLVRNGPGQFEMGQHHIRHWFDGYAMLHAFHIADGRVSYSNRFLKSKAYLNDQATGKLNYIGFAQDPCRALFRKFMTLFRADPGNNAVVNVTRLGDEFIAMTESPLTVRFDPRTLETLGVLDYDDDVAATLATAHPHYDSARGMGVNLMTEFGLQTKYQLFGITATERRKLTEIVSKDIAYMHSFGLTQRYAVIAQFSLRLGSAATVLLSGRPFIENFKFSPTTDTIFTIVELDTGRVVANVPTDAFFAFHHINAYEEGDEALIVDISAYPNADLIKQLYMEPLRRGETVDTGEFRRYYVPLNGKRATYERLVDVRVELPRINYRRNGLPYRYVYASASQPNQPTFLSQLAKVDTHLRHVTLWQEEGCYPGEPVFLSAPDSSAEDDGLVLSVVLDARRGTSFLLILDAASFGEVARAHVPQHIPFGFHGQFFGGVV